MSGREADSIARMARTSPDSRVLRERVLSALRQKISFEWYVFVLTDPRTSVGVDPLAHVPPGVELPGLIRAKYLTAVHRWTTLRAAASSGAIGPEHPAAGHGIADVLSAAFHDAHGCWGFLDLWSSQPFTHADAERLDAAAPAVTRAIRDVQGSALRQRSAQPPEGSVVVLLDGDLRVRGRTAHAEEWLARLLPPQDGRPVVPAVVLNVAAQLLAVEAGVDDHQPSGRVHLGSGAWVTVRAARLGSEAEIAVSMEPTSAAEQADLVGRAFGLTPRELTVLEQLCAGASTAAIATALHLSPLTVQDHVKSVFERTGVRTRGELVSLALGGATAPG